jgi:hypothetical protein
MAALTTLNSRRALPRAVLVLREDQAGPGGATGRERRRRAGREPSARSRADRLSAGAEKQSASPVRRAISGTLAAAVSGRCRAC